MRVLLVDIHRGVAPDNVIVMPGGGETVLVTLAGSEVRTGFVAEVDPEEVRSAIRRLPYSQAGPDVWREVELVARDMTRWVVGSRIDLVRGTHGRRLDTSGATAIEPVPGLGVGEKVVIGPPILDPFVNARGRVVAIDRGYEFGQGFQVRVAIMPEDRDRIEVADSSRLPATIGVESCCLRRAPGWRRRAPSGVRKVISAVMRTGYRLSPPSWMDDGRPDPF